MFHTCDTGVIIEKIQTVALTDKFSVTIISVNEIILC